LGGANSSGGDPVSDLGLHSVGDSVTLLKCCYTIRLLQNLSRRGRHLSASSRTSTNVVVGPTSSRETSLHAGTANDPSSTTYRPARMGPPYPSPVCSAMTPTSSSSARTTAIRPAYLPPPPPLPPLPWTPMASLPLHLPETSVSVPLPLSCVGRSPSPPSSSYPPHAYC
jgi:hypothetical protein